MKTLLSLLFITALVSSAAPAFAKSCQPAWKRLQHKGLTTPRDERLHLIVNMGVVGNADTDDSITDTIMERFREAFPGERVVYLFPRDLTDLKRRLRGIGTSGSQVASLLVIGHGSQRHLQLNNGDSHQGITLENLRESFGKLRFAPDATAVFSACQFIAKDPDHDIQELADGLGMVSGRVYANESMGIMARDMVLRQPFYAYGVDIKAVATLAVQATAPVSFPLYLGVEQALNRGRTLVREPGSNDCIEDGHLIDYTETELFSRLLYSHVTPEELARITPQTQSEAEASEIYDDPEFYETLEQDGSYNEDLNSEAGY